MICRKRIAPKGLWQVGKWLLVPITAGNLPDIAEAIHAKRPDFTMLIAADDDAKGHEAARLASQRTGAQIALPGEARHG